MGVKQHFFLKKKERKGKTKMMIAQTNVCKRADVSSRWRGDYIKMLRLLGIHLSAEKGINREFFSCI